MPYYSWIIGSVGLILFFWLGWLLAKLHRAEKYINALEEALDLIDDYACFE